MRFEDFWLMLIMAFVVIAAVVLIVFPVYYLVHIAHAPNWGVALYIFIWGCMGTTSFRKK